MTNEEKLVALRAKIDAKIECRNKTCPLGKCDFLKELLAMIDG
jgi:hypothetical protein